MSARVRYNYGVTDVSLFGRSLRGGDGDVQLESQLVVE